MSSVFNGVIFRTTESEAVSAFESLHSGVPLRLANLGDDVFGIYARRGGQQVAEALCCIAAEVSRITKLASFYFYDSRVGPWYRRYELGQLTREYNPLEDQPCGRWEEFEASATDHQSLHDRIETAFLWDTAGWIAQKGDFD